MAILSRVNYLSQQRLDLQHVIATDSFNAFDLRAFGYIFNGLEKNYVIRGLEVSALNGFTVTVKISNSLVLLPLDNEASFFFGLPDAEDEIINVPPSTEKIFIEAFVERVTTTPISAAFFDPSNTNDQNPAGQEFNASVDFQSIIKLQLRYNTEGFSVDAIPIAILKTDSTNVVNISDARDLFFRLGSGGALPSPYKKFAWSTNRTENALPASSIYLNQFTTENPYYTQDANGAINDKALTSLKDWMDAVMTLLAEMKGSASWYTPIAGKTIPSLLFLNPNATAFVPSTDGRTLTWTGTQLKSRSISSSPATPLTLTMNYGPVKWELGGSFINPFTNRAYSDTDFTATIPDNAAFFIKLDREKIPSESSGNSVKWGVETLLIPSPPAQNITVAGQEGDFTGVAIGDYIRKLGEDYYQYNRVVGIVEGGIIYSTNGRVATSITTALIVEYPIDVPTTEPFRWFRYRYQLSDLFVTSDTQGLTVQSVDASPLIIAFDDINMYFLGRRKGSLFQLRNYGVMQPGEEVPLVEDSDSSPIRSIPNLFLKLNYGIEINSSGTLSSLNSNILTIQKRKTANLVQAGLNNADAWHTFTIDSAMLNFANDGDGLWIRISDNSTSTPIALTSGVVDIYDVGCADDTYQILPASKNPVRDLRNKDVLLLARRTTFNGIVSLQFFDGSIVQVEGLALQRDLTKIITGVTTSTSATTDVTHGFLRNTADFIWNAKITSTGQNVWIGGTQTSTGVTLDSTPDGAQSLTMMFTRHLR